MHLKKYLAAATLSAQCFTVGTVAAQTGGDEDSAMYSHARERDQKAISDAVNGWWTASMKGHEERVAWWREAKFGMFIHWGVYSLPGGEWKGKRVGGYAEHLMRKEKITRGEYMQLAKQFYPGGFSAEQWILHAKSAGMKYFIVTAKHHDGFALFDSKFSSFDIMDQTSFRRDPMAELAAAAKKHGMKFGFYYSHAFDWEHPDAPGNDWEYNNPGGDRLIGGANWFDAHPEWVKKAQKYVDEKAIPQINELLSKYHPDILWFDTPHKLPLSENIKILKAIRQTDPGVVVNGRLVRSASANFGDYKNTADRPAEFFPVSGDWEAIPTTNESYGYSRFDSSHKPAGHFIRLLANAASRGGNLLMNIGPKGDGTFDEKDLSILKSLGTWLKKNGEGIYGTSATTLPLQSWGVSTGKGNKVYLHVHQYPADGRLHIGGLQHIPVKAYFLGEKTFLKITKQGEQDLVVHVPANAPDSIATVIVLEVKGALQKDSVRFVAPNVAVTRLLAFDAAQQGTGFRYGDGKTNRYYVEGWNTGAQQLSWRYRTSKAATYQVVAKYLAGTETAGGKYRVKMDDHRIEAEVVTDRQGTNVVTQVLGTFRLAAGMHSLAIEPVVVNKLELMKLLEVQLIAVENFK